MTNKMEEARKRKADLVRILLDFQTKYKLEELEKMRLAQLERIWEIVDKGGRL